MTDNDEAGDVRVVRHALIAGPARALGLLRRVPELIKKRGWPPDHDLEAVFAAAISLTKIRAGRTVFRRPAAADGCGGRWPAECQVMTARQIVDALELGDLLNP